MWAAVWGRCATHRSLAKLVSSYRFRAYTPPVAVAEFDEATSPANNAIPMWAAGPPFGVAAQPIAASPSSSAPTGFWRTRPPVAVAEFDEATSPANNAIPMRVAGPPLGVAAQPIAASPSSSAPTGFWRTRPPVAVAEFDEATSPTNNAIPMRAAGPSFRVAAQPIAASPSSSAPTGFLAYTPPRSSCRV